MDIDTDKIRMRSNLSPIRTKLGTLISHKGAYSNFKVLLEQKTSTGTVVHIRRRCIKESNNRMVLN